MLTRAAVVTLLMVGLAGCAASDPPQFDYLPPSGRPAAVRSAFVRQQPWLVWGNILDYLQQQGARVSGLDEAAGSLTVLYSGDPEPYVDCGWIVTYRGNDFERVPAARAEARFLQRRDGELVSLERQLTLDARVNVQVEPSGEDAVVRPNGIYVLTKTIRSRGAEQPLHAETISFQTGQSGRFSSGTSCQPNGALERLVLEALPTVSLAGN